MTTATATRKIYLDCGILTLTDNAVENLAALGLSPEGLQEAVDIHSLGSRGQNPAIYCGTWEKYNSGRLNGLWIDLTTFDSYQELMDFCKAIHCDEEFPEIMIQDYMNCSKNYRSEFFSEEQYEESLLYWELIENRGQDAIDDFLEEFDDLSEFDERFMGHFESRVHFAEWWIEQTGRQEELEKICPWIDYYGIAENMFAHDFHMGPNGNVFSY